MQIGVNIIGLPELIDFSRYENVNTNKKLVEPQSSFIPKSHGRHFQ